MVSSVFICVSLKLKLVATPILLHACTPITFDRTTYEKRRFATLLTVVRNSTLFVNRYINDLTMKLAILSLLAGAAAAFAPAQQAATTSALSMSDYSGEVGAQPPTGFFDPLKLSKGISPERFDLYRTAEMKHGRVAMLCVVGYVVPEIYRFPGEVAYGLKFADVPNGLDAIAAIPALGWAQIVAFVGSVEYSGTLGDFEIGKPDFAPEVLAARQAQELTHGRLAMIATLELLRHDRWDETGELIRGLPFLYN